MGANAAAEPPQRQARPGSFRRARLWRRLGRQYRRLSGLAGLNEEAAQQGSRVSWSACRLLPLANHRHARTVITEFNQRKEIAAADRFHAGHIRIARLVVIQKPRCAGEAPALLRSHNLFLFCGTCRRRRAHLLNERRERGGGDGPRQVVVHLRRYRVAHDRRRGSSESTSRDCVFSSAGPLHQRSSVALRPSTGEQML